MEMQNLSLTITMTHNNGRSTSSPHPFDQCTFGYVDVYDGAATTRLNEGYLSHLDYTKRVQEKIMGYRKK